MEGAGSTTCKEFVPFELEEVQKFIGVLYTNAFSPKPQLTFCLKSVGRSKVFGNDAFAKALDKHVSGARLIFGECQWNHFHRFMCLYDIRENP